MDLASHDFDAARFLTGQEVVDVLRRRKRAGGTGARDVRRCRLRDRAAALRQWRARSGAGKLGVRRMATTSGPRSTAARARSWRKSMRSTRRCFTTTGQGLGAARPIPGAVWRSLPAGNAGVRERVARRCRAVAGHRGCDWPHCASLLQPRRSRQSGRMGARCR